MNRFCTACGQAIPPGCLFCVQCGARQPSPPAPPEVTAPSPSPAEASHLEPAPPGPAPAASVSRSASPPDEPAPRARASGAEPTPPGPTSAVNASPAGSFSWPRAVSAMLASAALLGGLYRGWSSLGTPVPQVTTVTAPVAPTANEEPTADLALAEGEWTVDPRDPKYSESDRGSFYLHREGRELRGKGPEDSSFRLWAEGRELVGEARESGGKLWKMRWEWDEPGRKVRLRLTDSQGTSQDAVLIRPSDLPALTPTPTPHPLPVLYQVSGDVNGDGQPESIQVLGIDGQERPDTDGHKQMRILNSDSAVIFQSESFQEPFHLDTDSLAEKPEEHVGVHILPKRSGFPLIRLVFASASGNFVDFKFNGKQFVLAEIGD